MDETRSNLWADLAETYLRTRSADGDHELAKPELKKLVPEDAREATGHGSKSGAMSIDTKQAEGAHAAV